ncbi:MAG: aspartate carbamoyltransferase catalytic subunit [Bdellovibrionales bacterium]|nr:aspartate carbamoyltransferase catalytic subunit [Bdellovibrionales bacterium]
MTTKAAFKVGEKFFGSPAKRLKPGFISAAELSAEEIRYLLDAAKAFAGPVAKGETIPLLSGKTIVNLFFENSTRTRSSFEMATRRLGGAAMNFAASTSSVAKGETLIDTAKNLEAMKPHCLIVRHASAGSPYFLASQVDIPVVNAGDGFHEHPTQAMLDVFTMEEKLGTVKGKRVVILGDIAHSRVARSNIYLLKKMGASVAVCAPPTLLPPHPETFGVDFAYRPEELLPEADVVMALRVQLERQNRMQLPSIAEYSRFWGLNLERAKKLKKGAIILHPGPVNRGVELDTEVADGPDSVILDQVYFGVIVRMAILAHVVNPQGLKDWLKK